MVTAETKTVAIFSGSVCAIILIVLCGMLYVIDKKDALYTNELRARAARNVAAKEAKLLAARMSETARDRETLAQYVLTENSVADFLSLIGNLGRARGVTVQTRSLAVAPIDGSEVFEQLTLEVDVTGSFASATQMLSLLESLPYQVRVQTVTVNRANEAKGDGLWLGAYHLSVTKYK